MASKENLYNIGRILLAGSALSAAACSLEQKSPFVKTPFDVSQDKQGKQGSEVRGRVLTEPEIVQMRNYDNFMANVVKVEPTATTVPSPTAEPKQLKIETLAITHMTTEGAQLVEEYKTELPNILIKIGADGGQTEDLQMYYPIYRSAQDRFGVPWDLLWIIHGEESNVSRNAAAFESNIHYGSMQRAVAFHPQEDVDRANVGLEYLQALSVRHFDDAAEIVWAGAAVSEWAGPEKDYQKALLKYSAKGPAEERFQKFLEIESLLKP